MSQRYSAVLTTKSNAGFFRNYMLSLYWLQYGDLEPTLQSVILCILLYTIDGLFLPTKHFCHDREMCADTSIIPALLDLSILD